MTLADIITKVRSDAGTEDDWLFIVGDAVDLSLTTEAELSSVEIDEDNNFEEIAPAGFSERGLHSTIDYQTLEDCIRWSDRLTGNADDVAAGKIIRYYIRFDAWPDRLDAPDPPPFHETLAKLDREFYDKLGEERVGTKCKRDECARGTVQFSVLCRPHHFESIKGKPCPFTD